MKRKQDAEKEDTEGMKKRMKKKQDAEKEYTEGRKKQMKKKQDAEKEDTAVLVFSCLPLPNYYSLLLGPNNGS